MSEGSVSVNVTEWPYVSVALHALRMPCTDALSRAPDVVPASVVVYVTGHRELPLATPITQISPMTKSSLE